MSPIMLLARDAIDAGLPNPTGQRLANISIIFCSLAGFLVICRLLTRVFINGLTGPDDYTLIAALILAIGITICFNEEVHWGMGLHNWQVDKAHKVLTFKWLWVAQLLYKFANGMTKISILLLYLRIFPSKPFGIAAWIVMSFIVAYYTGAIAASIWQCDPISKAWEKTLPGKYIDIGKLWYANSVLTIVADVALIILPANQIARLKLPTSQKIGLMLVFSLGLFVMACTIVRMVALGPTVTKKDSLFNQAKSNSWTFLEVDVSIICASLPILKAPIKRFFPRLLASKSASTSGGSKCYNLHLNSRSQPKMTPHGIKLSSHSHSEWPRPSAAPLRSDKASDEEMILEDSRIRKTTSIRFDYREVDSEDKERKKDEENFDFGPHARSR